MIMDDRKIQETDNDGNRDLDWLISAFPLLSFEQIDSAYEEARRDTYKAAGILGDLDPRDSSRSVKKKMNPRKNKRIAASTGMVSGIIGKEYSKSVLACGGGGRGRVRVRVSPMETNKRVGFDYRSADAEDFLCSMLGDDSDLGMGVVKDVLGQCGYDLGKALDSLLDMSKMSKNQFKERIVIDHTEVVSGEIPREMLSKGPSSDEQCLFQLTDKPSVSTCHSPAKEQGTLQFVGSDFWEYLKVPVNKKEQVSSRSRMANPDPQKVLESLFNVPEMSYVVNSISWKNVVKQVESFGHGLMLSAEGTAEPSLEPRVGKEDDYHDFRNVAKQNWDTMRSFYHKATLAYSNGERAQASYLSEKGKYYKKLAHEADEKASQEIFEARNKGIKNTVTIDLHGQHVKQAIRLLKLHLLLFAYIPSVHFLRVITGCGANGVGLGKLKRTKICRPECRLIHEIKIEIVGSVGTYVN